jgi:hypothetical protein
MLDSPHIWKCQRCREYYSAYSNPLTRCPFCRNVNKPTKEHFYACPEIQDLTKGSPLNEYEYYLYLNEQDGLETEFELRWKAYELSRCAIRNGDEKIDDNRSKNMKRLFEILRTQNPSTAKPENDIHYETCLLREMGLFKQCIDLANSIDLRFWSERVLIDFILASHQIAFPFDKVPPQLQKEADSIRDAATKAYMERHASWQTELDEFTNSIQSKGSEFAGCLLLLIGLLFCVGVGFASQWYYGLILALVIFMVWGNSESGEDKVKKILSDWKYKNPEPKPPSIRFAPIPPMP